MYSAWTQMVKWIGVGAVLLTAGGLAGCGRSALTEVPAPESTSFVASTADPVVARTLQSNTEATAAWLLTQPAYSTPTEEPFPTVEPVEVEGVPPAQRTGPCEAPADDYVIHTREGFCLSAPANWKVMNVDGGMAASLRTTPGQAIALQPDWAAQPEICNLLIYTSVEPSAIEHLNTRFYTFAGQSNLTALTGVQMVGLGGMALAGFTWETTGGATGGVYAAMLGPNRLLHISLDGTDCLPEALEPVLETLRFDE